LTDKDAEHKLSSVLVDLPGFDAKAAKQAHVACLAAKYAEQLKQSEPSTAAVSFLPSAPSAGTSHPPVVVVVKNTPRSSAAVWRDVPLTVTDTMLETLPRLTYWDKDMLQALGAPLTDTTKRNYTTTLAAPFFVSNVPSK
jgi:hypothetical protein